MSTLAAPLNPRKSPVQARSAVTIEALHVAVIQVLTREGLSRCTTTRIAERAGVSIGTLYQYFPSKEAIAVALLELHIADTDHRPGYVATDGPNSGADGASDGRAGCLAVGHAHLVRAATA